MTHSRSASADEGARETAIEAAEERAVLLACLEWQVEAGCDGWFANDKDQGQGWSKAESRTQKLLQDLLETLAPKTFSHPQANSQDTLEANPEAVSPALSPTSQPLDKAVARAAFRAASGATPSDATPSGATPSGATPSGAAPSLASPALPRAALQSPPPLLAPAEAVIEVQKAAEACSTLEELEKAVRVCTLCPLKKVARSTVFAEGNPDADLMIVGEAPGREEDEQGKPFVGASGQLLIRMLRAIGITSREQYRITNLVYWRPPGNRPPDSDELAVCRPFFLRHIALVKPRWLLLLGNVAAQNVLLERRGISKLRGQFFPLTLATTSVLALPSFHPSYLLRTPAKKAAAWHDLLLLHRAMQHARVREA